MGAILLQKPTPCLLGVYSQFQTLVPTLMAIHGEVVGRIFCGDATYLGYMVLGAANINNYYGKRLQLCGDIQTMVSAIST